MNARFFSIASVTAAGLALSACAEPVERQTDDQVDAAATDREIAAGPDGGSGGGAAAPEEATVTEEIPAGFLGVWDSEEGACEPTSENRLEVSPELVGFYESRGTVTQVEIESMQEINVSFDMEGEGETWAMTRGMALSDDGTTLTLSGVDGQTQIDPVPLTMCKG